MNLADGVSINKTELELREGEDELNVVRQVDQDRVSHSDQSGNQTVCVINSHLPDCLHAVKRLPSMGRVSPERSA